MGFAVRIGLSVERRAVDRVLDSGALERILTAALGDAHVQAGFRRALGSDGARRLVDSLFDSGLFDHFIERLAASDVLWRLVDQSRRVRRCSRRSRSRVLGSPIRPAKW